MQLLSITEETKKSDEVKSNILLTCMRPQEGEVHNTIVFDDNSIKMNFNPILQQFGDYCYPEKK